MKYSAKQLSNGRWGIYNDLQLLATVGCENTCQIILYSLKNPSQETLKQIDLLKVKKSQTTSSRKSSISHRKVSAKQSRNGFQPNLELKEA